MKAKGMHIAAIIIISILIGAGIAWTDTVTLPYTFVPNTPARADEVNANFVALQAELDLAINHIYELEAKLAYMSVEETAEIDGVAGPHVIFEGVNVHVRSGAGSTSDAGSLTGLGNLIIGYNEEPVSYDAGRGGSHNLVLGSENQFSSHGGIVAGYQNIISNQYATVTGGRNNIASGQYSSISGGGWEDPSWSNIASGDYSSINGGGDNTASGLYSSVTGGLHNTASVGWCASVSGGLNNTADGNYSSISGGNDNTASGSFSSVTGGAYNGATGQSSSVSGGNNRSVSGVYDWRGGGCYFCED